MSQPRSVVIPFGVPSEGRGLGLGLAALVHSFAQIEGHTVALAQLHARRREEETPEERQSDAGRGRPGTPLESYVSPSAWRDLSGMGHAPAGVGVVITGALEPPGTGRGQIQLLAFDAVTGSVRAKVEGFVDVHGSGESLVAAFERVWSTVGGELGSLRDIRELDWDALESVLLAERCAMHDAARGGPHDRLAAMLHLGRAIGDAPEARFPAERLATLALETALSAPPDPKLAHAALRALARASDDAPSQADLTEAAAALNIRLGRPEEAEARMGAVIAVAPSRLRPYAILSQARRAQGDLDGALRALDAGLGVREADAMLTNERGVILAERGEVDAAVAAWRLVLTREPLNPPAFSSLAATAVQRRDAALAQLLVDGALAGVTGARPEVLRRALELAIASETPGLARGARIRTLAGALLELAPDDAGAMLVLGRAHAELGEEREALERLGQVERMAPGSAFAAEATKSRFALEDPCAAAEVESALRAARQAEGSDLDDVASRAQHLGTLHGSWRAFVAAGIAHRARGRLSTASHALGQAIAIAPGAAEAHLELALTYETTGTHDAARKHAELAARLDPTNRDGLSLLQRFRAQTKGDRRSLLVKLLGWFRGLRR